jgi:transcription antitermination protein NusB
MISRRLIRIKIVQVLYSHYNDEKSTLDKTEKEFNFSIKKAYDLYHYMIGLLIKVADYSAERREIAKQKNLPTYEDLNPNTRFTDNLVIAKLRNCHSLNDYISGNKLSWADHPELIRKLYLKICEKDYFLKYMNGPKPDFEKDKQIITDIFSNEFEEWEFLYQILEEQSIYWNDDIEFVLSMIIKTIDSLSESQEVMKLMPLYKNDDDRDFGKNLLRKSIIKYPQFRDTIDKHTQNWEVERIALMDILIMVAALTEIMEFPSIPVKVTLNEYIDIARYYSTSKSNEFVNGILDKIVNDFKKDNLIIKTGRGLIDESKNKR